MTRYLPTDPVSHAGVLIPKRRAPKCVLCGRVLWVKARPCAFDPVYNRKRERLGYVPTCGGTHKKSWCWNGQLCAKRAKAKENP